MVRSFGCRGSHVLDHGIEGPFGMRKGAVVIGTTQINAVELHFSAAALTQIVLVYPVNKFRVLGVFAKAPGKRSTRDFRSIARSAGCVIVHSPRFGERCLDGNGGKIAAFDQKGEESVAQLQWLMGTMRRLTQSDHRGVCREITKRPKIRIVSGGLDASHSDCPGPGPCDKRSVRCIASCAVARACRRSNSRNHDKNWNSPCDFHPSRGLQFNSNGSWPGPSSKTVRADGVLHAVRIQEIRREQLRRPGTAAQTNTSVQHVDDVRLEKDRRAALASISFMLRTHQTVIESPKCREIGRQVGGVGDGQPTAVVSRKINGVSEMRDYDAWQQIDQLGMSPVAAKAQQ